MGSQTHAFTARFDPQVYEELRSIADLRGDSINSFVVEAVKRRLRTSRRQLLERYQEKIETLKAYAERDPDFEDAIQAFADAETDAENLSAGDPAEGEVVATGLRGDDVEGRLEEILEGG